VFKSYGAVSAFAGPVSTVKCFEDNSVVKAAVEEPGAGRVLVVDGGASLRCALVGGNIAAAAAKNGWAGLVIHGAVRDVAELRACAIGILALGSHPMASVRRDEGQRDLPVSVQGVLIWPGDWLTVDEDGLVLSRPA
jgi:regulator of ribonuclease activity A